MKVITLISGGDIGGAKTHVLSLLHGLGKTEQVRLVCFREGEFAEDARKLGIDTCVMEVSVGVAIGRLTQMIREEGFQIIPCHGARANLTGALLRRKVRVPCGPPAAVRQDHYHRAAHVGLSHRRIRRDGPAAHLPRL